MVWWLQENLSIACKILLNKKTEIFLQVGCKMICLSFYNSLWNVYITAFSRSIHIKINGNPKTELDSLAVKCYTMLQENYKGNIQKLWKCFMEFHFPN